MRRRRTGIIKRIALIFRFNRQEGIVLQRIQPIEKTSLISQRVFSYAENYQSVDTQRFVANHTISSTRPPITIPTTHR